MGGYSFLQASSEHESAVCLKTCSAAFNSQLHALGAHSVHACYSLFRHPSKKLRSGVTEFSSFSALNAPPCRYLPGLFILCGCRGARTYVYVPLNTCHRIIHTIGRANYSSGSNRRTEPELWNEKSESNRAANFLVPNRIGTGLYPVLFRFRFLRKGTAGSNF